MTDRYASLEPLTNMVELCTASHPDEPEGTLKLHNVEILAMAFKGTGVCGDICRKRKGRVVLRGEKPSEEKVGINPTGEC